MRIEPINRRFINGRQPSTGEDSISSRLELVGQFGSMLHAALKEQSNVADQMKGLSGCSKQTESNIRTRTII
jgi:hypothetical protein